MTDDLKTRRATAKCQFTRSERRLKDALASAESIPISTIERRYDELNSKWVAAQEAHDAYVEKISSENISGTETEEEESWIDELNSRFDSIEIDADRVIERLKLKNSSVEPVGITTSAVLHDSSAQDGVNPTSSSSPSSSNLKESN